MKKSHTDKADLRKLWDLVVLAGSLGLTLFICLVVGVFFGRLVDTFLGTTPWGLIFFSLLGAISGFWSLAKKALAYQKKGEKKDE